MRLRPLWIALVVLGVLARCFAVLVNDVPHGDVHLDALTLGALWDGRGLTTPLERSIELYARDSIGNGYPLDQHPPLSILLGALFPIGGDSYFALQIIALLAGLVGLILTHRLARRILVDVDPWVVTALIATSFALADFAGNGSVYTLHGTWTLAAITALGRRTVKASAIAGVCAGLAYLTNYQAAPLVLVLAAGLFIERRRLAKPGAWIAPACAVALGFVIVVAPWWVRNVVVFGEPTFSVNPLYLKVKLGYAAALAEWNGTTLATLTKPALAVIAKNWLAIMTGNARFVAEQSLVWLAALAPLSVLGAWFALRPRGDASTYGLLERRLLALVVCAHLAVMLAWPLCKFRYLIPWFGPVILLAVSGIDQWGARAPAWRSRLVALAVGTFLLMQGALVVASKTFTTYDDGILARDAMGNRGGEIADRAKQKQLASAAIGIAMIRPACVIADIELAIHLLGDRPPRVVQAPQLGPPLLGEVVRRVQKVHGATHILALTAEDALLYERELGAVEVFRTDDDGATTALLQLP